MKIEICTGYTFALLLNFILLDCYVFNYKISNWLMNQQQETISKDMNNTYGGRHE